VRVLAFEAEELMDHLRSRPDIWHEGDDLMFVRTDREGTMCLGLKLVPPAARGTYSTWMLHVLPSAWDAGESAVYVEQLVCKWTSFSLRQRFARFFMTELKLPPKTAEAAALICAVIVCEADPDPEATWQPPLPDITTPKLLPRVATTLSQTYLLQGRGWLKLELAGNMIGAEMSVSDPDGEMHRLRGFVKGTNGSPVRDLAAGLFGWPLEDPDAVVNPEERQMYFDRKGNAAGTGPEPEPGPVVHGLSQEVLLGVPTEPPVGHTEPEPGDR
jgi:hypothetical protein